MNSFCTLTSSGAAGEVTGSKHLLETASGSKILLDCGLFQGRREEALTKNCCFQFDPAKLDAVILSHAHIDHTGLIPKLCKEGFKGAIYCTKGTQELSIPMLLDSARIQQEDESFLQRHHLENRLSKKLPLYSESDVQQCFQQFDGKPYDVPFEITSDVTAEFIEAGHVFGSAISILTIKTPQGKRILVYTGDLGRDEMLILKDPAFVESADYLIIESTYGNRVHEEKEHTNEDLRRIILKTVKRGGKIFIPAFALERTQEIILRLEELIHTGAIPNLPIYVDSPLATKITKIFEKYPEYYDEEMKSRLKKKRKIFSFPNLRFTENVEESKKLNFLNIPCIIIAGSGMCENGRIRHHLKNNIEDSKHSILIVGYQAENTLGRKLIDGRKIISIFDHDYRVNAEIVVFQSLSAHADQNDLDDYVKAIHNLKKIFLVHGEEISRQAFAKRISAFYKGAEIILPRGEESYELE